MKEILSRMGRLMVMIVLFIIIKVFFPQGFIFSLNEFVSSTGNSFKEAFFSSLSLMMHFVMVVTLGLMTINWFTITIFNKSTFTINRHSVINTIVGLVLIFINLVLFKLTPKTIDQQMLESFDVESSFSMLEDFKITLQYIIKKGQWFVNIGLLLIIGNSITKEDKKVMG